MTVGGLRSIVRTGEHDHGDRRHSHPHLRLPLPGIGSEGHDHRHDARSYLATGLVGAGVGGVFERTRSRRVHGVARAATVGLAAWLLAGVVPVVG